MATVQFYHLTTSPMERALPKLLEKALAAGFRISVVTGSDAQVERLDQLLWVYDPDSFLPHASAKTGDAKDQPVWITTQIEQPNDATLLCVTNGATVEETGRFERIIDMFDGRDAAATEAARNRWKAYKEAGHNLAYLQQNEAGGWEQKAVA